MKNIQLLCGSLLLIITLNSCGGNKNEQSLSVEAEKSKCKSVQDCLDKKDFESARTFCVEEGESCDKKSILEIESQFWIDQDEYKRAQQIALEIYSYTSLEKIDQNNWYSEKLNDIVSRAVIQNKLDEADKIANDFPLEIKGDKTLKFKVDALKTIIDGYDKNNQKTQVKLITEKLKVTENKLKEYKSQREKEKKEEIAKLQKEINKLQKEKIKKSKELKTELKELKKEKNKAESRLEEIQKDFYIFSSRREKDLNTQQEILDDINRKIEQVETDIETIYDSEIEEMGNRINELKNETY
jgi:hypothetical protein